MTAAIFLDLDIQAISATLLGNSRQKFIFIQYFDFFKSDFFSLNLFCSASKAKKIYEQVFLQNKNKSDNESQTILRTIESVTKMLTNFAKYG